MCLPGLIMNVMHQWQNQIDQFDHHELNSCGNRCNQSSKLSKYIQKSLLALSQSTLNRTAGPKKRQTCKMTSTKTLSGIYHSNCIYLVYLFSKWTKLTSLMLTHLPPVSQTGLKPSPRLKCKSELFQLK